MALFDDEDETTPTPVKPVTQDMSSEDMWALALTALAPALIGGAVGGKAGMYGGASVGAKGAAQVFQNDADIEKEQKKTLEAAKAAEAASKRRVGEGKEVAAFSAGLKPPQYMKNALGQIVNPDTKEIVDPTKEPIKPVADPLGGWKMEKTIENAGKELGTHGEMFNAIAAVEKQLGFSMEDLDDSGRVKTTAKDGKVTYKEVDLPGASVPFVGRVSGYDPDARTLQSRIAKVFNVELKDRSGAAVTDSELERLKTEFAAGKFNSEAEMLTALRDYKQAARAALANAEARYPPEAVKEFGERGGFTSAGVKSPAAIPQGITKEDAAKELLRRKEAQAAKNKSGNGG